MKRPNVLIWHIHGSYLNYIVRANASFYLPVKPDRADGYGGKGWTFRWPDNVQEVPSEEVRSLPLDVVIHQSPRNFFEDQHEILSEEQRRLPRIYLEHNTPREHPTDYRHPIDDPEVLLVHVTHFNRLMWDSGRTPTTVVEHGIVWDEDAAFTGELDRGIVVVNHIQRRGRIAGYDVWDAMRGQVPLDLAGMGSESLGGLGDIPHFKLAQEEARYRFFFNPIRYTSLPLALLEAMAIGLPVVALATTEIPTVIENGVNGYTSCDLDYLRDRMLHLIADPSHARELGCRARDTARQRFSIERFARDWDRTFEMAIDLAHSTSGLGRAQL